MAVPLAELFRHHLWANEKLLDARDALDDAELTATAPGAYGPIRDTLVHSSPRRPATSPPSAASRVPNACAKRCPSGVTTLRDSARNTGTGFIALAESVQPERRINGEQRGVPYDLPISICLAQAINHGTEHRANVTTILSARGIDAPVLDLWQYARERAGMAPSG